MFIVFVYNIISILRQSHSALSQFCIELTCEVGNELLHDSINLLVIQCLLLILEDEVYSIALLALWQVLTLIYVEEYHALQKLLLCLMGNLLNLCKLYVLVNGQCKVTAYRWILADICVSKVHLLHGLHQVIPVNISMNTSCSIWNALLQLVAQDTHLYQYLAGTGLVVHTLGKDVVVAVLDNQVVLWHTPHGGGYSLPLPSTRRWCSAHLHEPNCPLRATGDEE